MARKTGKTFRSQPWSLAIGLLFASAATLAGVCLGLEPDVILQRAAGSAVGGVLIARVMLFGLGCLVTTTNPYRL